MMKKIEHRKRSSLLSVVMMVAVMVSACGGNQTSTAPAPASTPTVAPTREPSVAPTVLPPTSTATKASPTARPTPLPIEPTAAYTPTPEGATQATLSPNGPWLVFNTEQGLAALNADGSGLTKLTDALPIFGSDVVDGAAPSGQWLAFRAGQDFDFGTDAHLYLMHLPDGKVTNLTPLLSSQVISTIIGAELDPVDASQTGLAATGPNALSWSPDGRYLAFVAALDGPSSDLYVYDTQTQQITLLNNEPNQAASLLWSPDSQWIVHQAVTSFGTGAGWGVKAVWAASPTGPAKKLYDSPPDGGGEIFAGWTAPNRLVVYTWTEVGERQARTIDLNTRKATSIFEGPFEFFALDPKTGQHAYVVSENTYPPSDLPNGLYTAFGTDAAAELIGEGPWYRLEWSPAANAFFATGETGVTAINTEATLSFENESQPPVVSPDGTQFAFWSDGEFGTAGLRVYPFNKQQPRQITSAPVSTVTWSPDGKTLFYLTGDTLYAVKMPAGQPTPIGEGETIVNLNKLSWVYP